MQHNLWLQRLFLNSSCLCGHQGADGNRLGQGACITSSMWRQSLACCPVLMRMQLRVNLPANQRKEQALEDADRNRLPRAALPQQTPAFDAVQPLRLNMRCSTLVAHSVQRSQSPMIDVAYLYIRLEVHQHLRLCQPWLTIQQLSVCV